MSGPCPWCGYDGGFHDNIVHARVRALLPYTKRYIGLVPGATDGHRPGNAPDVPGHLEIEPSP